MDLLHTSLHGTSSLILTSLITCGRRLVPTGAQADGQGANFKSMQLVQCQGLQQLMWQGTCHGERVPLVGCGCGLGARLMHCTNSEAAPGFVSNDWSTIASINGNGEDLADTRDILKATMARMQGFEGLQVIGADWNASVEEVTEWLREEGQEWEVVALPEDTCFTAGGGSVAELTSLWLTAWDRIGCRE